MVKVDTREYVLAHGKKPAGPGEWAFMFCGVGAVFTREQPFRVGRDAKSRQLPMYAAAMKHVCRFAKAVGAKSVTLLP